MWLPPTSIVQSGVGVPSSQKEVDQQLEREGQDFFSRDGSKANTAASVQTSPPPPRLKVTSLSSSALQRKLRHKAGG